MDAFDRNRKPRLDSGPTPRTRKLRTPLVPEIDEAELRRHIETALVGLKSAGIDWVPKPVPLPRRALSNSRAPNPVIEAPMPVASADRRQQLDVLAAEIKPCTRCPELASTRTQTVFGDGQPGADICFLGEAPGADEDAQGIPFVGAAGQLLNKIIAACGLKREEVYICNILKCRPPGNRTPLPNEADNCSGFLKRQLDIVKPKYIVCLGSTAAKYLLNSTKSLGALRNAFHEFNGIPVIVTYHPAYLLPHRAPAKKKEVWEDMKMLLTKMGRPIPSKKEGES
jgi:uracil-DNA glycosylase family 4